MILHRTVIGSQTKIFPEGLAFTIPSAGTASAIAKPGITDTAWIDIGPIKWTKNNTSKTEDHMVASPGAYVVEDEVVLSKGLKLKGKIEKQSNLAYQLALCAAAASGAALPVSPTAGGQYNPLAGSPILRAWVHVQEYDQNNTLLNTVDYWCAIKASGDTNNDDKAAETPIEATVLFSTLNSGTLT
ncbi:MAG: hypothetical protein WC378_15395 [Opitutaceae bacterium]|jgi:hypothetical protein